MPAGLRLKLIFFLSPLQMDNPSYPEYIQMDGRASLASRYHGRTPLLLRQYDPELASCNSTPRARRLQPQSKPAAADLPLLQVRRLSAWHAAPPQYVTYANVRCACANLKRRRARRTDLDTSTARLERWRGPAARRATTGRSTSQRAGGRPMAVFARRAADMITRARDLRIQK